MYNQPLKPISIYTHTWYGKIKRCDELSTFETKTYKIGVGLSYQFKDKNSLYLGINKSYFFATKSTCLIEGPEKENLNSIHKISFEIGIVMKVERISLFMMSDLLNWESMVGFSYQLKK
jgi:hypothetical protein